MLSTKAITNVSDASHYYSHEDNYYLREDGFAQSIWWGKGASTLGLSGPVDSKTFNDLLSGKLPNGQQLGKKVGDEINHRPGWDLTFSPPKSVSLLAIMGGDKRLVDAHIKAVNTALSYIEYAFSEARLRTTNGMVYQKTSNLTACLFLHDVSRELDPQMHTHAVVMNMTQRLDGKWRSLASSMDKFGEQIHGNVNGFYEQVMHFKKFLGKIYSMELMHATKGLGYELETDPETGFTEIKGVPNEAIALFSKRREQIVTALQQHNFSGGKAASIAALATRQAKKDVDRELLRQGWLEESELLGLDLADIIAKSYQRLDINGVTNALETTPYEINAVKHAMKSLSQFQPTFTLHELIMESVMMADYANYTLAGLKATVDSLVKEGELINITNEKGKTILMTKETRENEIRLVDALTDNKKPLPSVDPSLIENYCTQHTELEHLKDTLVDIFNNERVLLIEGEHTRETLLGAVIHIAQAHDLKVALLSPNLIASKEVAREYFKPKNLWEKIKSLFIDDVRQSKSISQFLSEHNENNKNAVTDPDIILVNQAHLLSTEQKTHLAAWNRTHDTKLLLLTERDKLLPQKVGTDTQFLEARGLSSISLVENKPQAGNRPDKVEITAKQITEVKDPDDRLQSMATHFTRLSDKERQSSYLVAQGKQKVDALNLLSHLALKNTDKLCKSINIEVLIPHFIPDGKQEHCSTYRKGQTVRFNDNYKSLNIIRGEYLQVISNNRHRNRVVLQKSTGEELVWQPDKLASNKVEVFDVCHKEISVGERILFKRSIVQHKIVKGETLTVLKLNPRLLSLINTEGKKIHIDLSKERHRHFDYGYAGTPYDVAHTMPAHIIAELPAKAAVTNQRTLRQLVTQANAVHIYTENLREFAKKVETNLGDKVPIETILADSDNLKNNLHTLYDTLANQMSKTDDPKLLTQKAVDAIHYAIHHLSEREAGFSHKELLDVAYEYAKGDVTFLTLTMATVQIEKAGILARGTLSNGTLWTTADAVKIEREIIEYCNKDRGMLPPIADNAHICEYARKNTLNVEQVNALKKLLQSNDRIMAVQGRAGTGKTTMFATFKEILDAKKLVEQQGYELLGLAPTNVAAKELIQRGIQAETLDSFIVNMDREKSLSANGKLDSKENLILIVDEASMVSNRKMLVALKTAHELNARLILTGDTQQQPSVEAGKAQSLVHTQLEPVELHDIRRQNDPVLKKAVKEIYDKEWEKAFTTLNEMIVEVPKPHNGANQPKTDVSQNLATAPASRSKRIQAMVDYYFSIRKDEHDDIALMVLGNDDRKLVNAAIHQARVERGELKGDESTFDILTNVKMTYIERSTIRNLKIGQFLRFSQRESKHINAGDYLEIVDKTNDGKYRLLTLKNYKGKEIIWELPSFDSQRLVPIEVFAKEHRKLQAGDRIRWLRTDKDKHILASEKAEVTKIEGNLISVMLADGKALTYSAKDPKYQHWDHAYAATSFNLQAQTVSKGIAHMESHRRFLANQKSFLVLITRVKDQLRIYTDNKKKLISKIMQNTGDKISSLEVIGQYPESKPSTKISKDHHEKRLVARQGDMLRKIKYSKADIAIIKDKLQLETATIATAFLGKPTMSMCNTLRFGRKGSVAIFIKGDKIGGFYNFEEGKGGDIFTFIQTYGNMNRADAIDYGARLIGHHVSSTLHSMAKNSPNPDTNAQENPRKSERLDLKKRIAFAQNLAKQSQPISGTLVQEYLEKYRGISMEKYPEDIRFHPGIYSKINGKTLPAMLVLARNKNGEIQAVQATYLDKLTARKVDENVAKIMKQTFGTLHGATVNIDREGGKKTLIAEGVETGLSLAQSIGDVNVKITLGLSNFKHLDARTLTKDIVFCLDNDGKNLQIDKSIREAANALNHNKNITFMMPNHSREQKQDYNDVIRKSGVETIREDYKNAKTFEEFYGSGGIVSPQKLDEKDLSKLARIVDNMVKNEGITDAMIADFVHRDGRESGTIPEKVLGVEKVIDCTVQHKDSHEPKTKNTVNRVPVIRDIDL